MAKRRKKSSPVRKRRTRSRRMSGVSSSQIMEIGLAAAGAVAGAVLSNQLKRQNKFIAAGAPLVAGIVLPMFVKNPMAKSLGLGMAAAGALKLANQFTNGKIGEVIGAADDEIIEVEMLSGVDDDGVMGSGADDDDDYSEGMSGTDYEEAGFEA